MTTIDDIYAAINPLPAMLSAKGKVRPEVRFNIEANANLRLDLCWKKEFSNNEWEFTYEIISGDTFDKILAEALQFIHQLPSADDAKLHHFMNKLGKLIDVGRAEGIALDYLNPLTDTMKRLSENVITYKPAPEPVPY